jgi:hypothetical protein
MAMTAGDLERLYRYIPGGENAKFDGSSATLDTPGRGWSMRVLNPRTRSIGLLTLPLAGVEIEAWGYSKDEFDGLVERILLVFRRGGG